jgi:hypothetical protein
MSFPGTYNINYYYGDTLEFRVFPKNSSGEPFDLSTFTTPRFTIARNRNTSVEDHIVCFAQIDPDNTSILCAIRPEDSEKLDANLDGSFPSYVYDVEISKTANPYDIVYTLLTGSLSTTRDITRADSGVIIVEIPENPTSLVLDSSTNSSLTVSWTAPSSGDAPTNYKLAILPFTENILDIRQAVQSSNLAIAASNTSYTFPGLSPSTNYSIGVRSTNSAGDADLSTILFNPAAFTTAAPAATAPAAPVITSLTPIDSGLEVSFTAGATGGSAITNYKYSIDGSTYVALDPASTTSPLTISGLTNGTLYPVTIKAVNSVGDSEPSNILTGTPTSGTPETTVPSAPTINSLTPGDTSIVVNFTAGSDGGSPVTNYKYSIDGTNYTAFNPAVTSSPVTITGLESDTLYSVTLIAVNAIGDSLPSAASTTTTTFTEEADFFVTSSGTSAYIIDGESNPTLTLVRGETYIFDINASGHPFWIQTSSGAYNSANVLTTSDGVEGNGTSVGTITWTVAQSAPNTLYYVCQFHSSMQGTINIIDGVS